MENDDQRAGFYYRVTCSVNDQIRKGDIVLIDPRVEMTPGSIVLFADPGGELRRMTEHDQADQIVGKVTQVFFYP